MTIPLKEYVAIMRDHPGVVDMRIASHAIELPRRNPRAEYHSTDSYELPQATCAFELPLPRIPIPRYEDYDFCVIPTYGALSSRSKTRCVVIHMANSGMLEERFPAFIGQHTAGLLVIVIHLPVLPQTTDEVDRIAWTDPQCTAEPANAQPAIRYLMGLIRAQVAAGPAALAFVFASTSDYILAHNALLTLRNMWVPMVAAHPTLQRYIERSMPSLANRMWPCLWYRYGERAGLDAVIRAADSQAHPCRALARRDPRDYAQAWRLAGAPRVRDGVRLPSGAGGSPPRWSMCGAIRVELAERLVHAPPAHGATRGPRAAVR